MTVALRCGIVLHPAGHTRSPAMHTAAYAALGLDADYRAFDVPPDALADALTRLRAEGVRQLAVSIPHKESMMGYVDELEPVGRHDLAAEGLRHTRRCQTRRGRRGRATTRARRARRTGISRA